MNIFYTNFALINAHTFSIGFKSGEYSGQSITVISLSLHNFNASNDQWTLQLSICGAKWLLFKISLNSSKPLFNIPIYFYLLIFSSNIWRVTFPFAEIAPHRFSFYSHLLLFVFNILFIFLHPFITWRIINIDCSFIGEKYVMPIFIKMSSTPI